MWQGLEPSQSFVCKSCLDEVAILFFLEMFSIFERIEVKRETGPVLKCVH